MNILSGLLSAFLAVSAKSHRSKPGGFSLFDLRKHLKNPPQNTLKINLNSF